MIVLAVVGLAVTAVLRVRVGWWLALTAVVLAVGFVVCPEDRLWNARILPFYYLCLCLLAAIGVAEVARALALLTARDPKRPGVRGSRSACADRRRVRRVRPRRAAARCRSRPERSKPTGQRGAGVSVWDRSALICCAAPARDFARWNFTGYEGKPYYPEYYALIDTMAGVGRTNGCGRAMWEYDGERLNGYGTPMAPMLLPYWTNGCIGSMEGLYFESSATTPFHFLNQSELSTGCSCAQRNLPYGGFNLDIGVKHMQLLGVRYYVASTPAAVQAARQRPELTEITSSGPWHIFEVANSDLVVPLPNEPAVVTSDTEGLD